MGGFAIARVDISTARKHYDTSTDCVIHNVKNFQNFAPHVDVEAIQTFLSDA